MMISPTRERQVLVHGGTVVDATGARRADVLVKGEVIASVDEPRGPGEVPAGAIVLDATGCAVSPGLVDLHAHLREPGAEEAGDDRNRFPGRRSGRLHGRRGDAEHRAGR